MTMMIMMMLMIVLTDNMISSPPILPPGTHTIYQKGKYCYFVITLIIITIIIVMIIIIIITLRPALEDTSAVCHLPSQGLLQVTIIIMIII